MCFLHVEGVAGTGQLPLKCRQEKTVSPLFVRGRPVLKILHDSGLAPKCDIPPLRTPLRSCRTMFTESQKNERSCMDRLLCMPEVLAREVLPVRVSNIPAVLRRVGGSGRVGACQGFFRIIKNQGGGGTPPPKTPPPLPRSK